MGSRVDLEHLAPSAAGARVEATAVLQAVTGPRLTFTVTAREGDKMVGRGTVERVVVDRLRFLAQAGGAGARGGPV